MRTYRSGEIVGNSLALSGLTCERSEAHSTNWPTVAENLRLTNIDQFGSNRGQTACDSCTICRGCRSDDTATKERIETHPPRNALKG